MSRRFMAAAASYHRRQQHQHQQGSNHNRSQLLNGDDEESTASAALLDHKQRQSTPLSPGSEASSPFFPTAATGTSDPNVSSLAVPSSSSPSPSTAQKQQKPKTVLPNRGGSTTAPAVEKGAALQFLPALSSNNKIPGTSWDDADDDNHHDDDNSSEEKKRPDRSVASSTVSGATSASMAFRARQYKQQRRAQRGAASRSSAATSSSVANSILQTAALAFQQQKRKASSPPPSRPKSPLLAAFAGGGGAGARPRSPLSLLRRPRSPVTTRPRSPLASKSPSRFRQGNPTMTPVLRPSSKNNSTQQSKRPQTNMDDLEPEPLPGDHDYNHNDDGRNEADDDNDSANDVPPSSAAPASRVSKIASMFGSGSANNNNSGGLSSPIATVLRPVSPAPSPPPPPAHSSALKSSVMMIKNSSSPYSRLRKSPMASPDHSAATSSASSAPYVGWPGTQDSRGKTVVMPQSSNEETSSAGGASWPGGGGNRSFFNSNTKNEKKSQPENRASPPFSSSKSAIVSSSPGIASSLLRRHQEQLQQRGAVFASPENNKQRSFLTPTKSFPQDPQTAQPIVVTPDDIDETTDYLADAISQSSPNKLFHQQAAAAAQSSARRRILGYGRQQNHGNNSAATRNLRAAPQPSRTFVLAQGRHWGREGNADDFDETPSSPSTAFSKTSSAYFMERDVNPLLYPDFQQPPLPFNPYGGRSTTAAAAESVLRSQQLQNAQHRPPTEASLAKKDYVNPPHRTYSAGAHGFDGLLDKTKEFPALMDSYDSDNSSRGTNYSTASQSDVFDGVMSESGHVADPHNLLMQPHKFVRSNSRVKKANYPESIAEEDVDQQDHFSPQPAGQKATENQRLYTASPLRTDAQPTPRHRDNDINDPFAVLLSHHRSQKDNRERCSSPLEAGATENDYGPQRRQRKDKIVPRRQDEESNDDYKVVLLGGGMTAIQATPIGYANRTKPADYEDTDSVSDVESNGFVRTPSFREMKDAGTTENDASILSEGIGNQSLVSSSARSYVNEDDLDHDGDVEDEIYVHGDEGHIVEFSRRSDHLAMYSVEPTAMKQVLRMYRQMSDRLPRRRMSLIELERLEDENKAFALLEMRSRIMEKDMERGLERRGGTSMVDDLVTTPYNRTASRIRDAVIVAKAWRDGASPKDVINTAILTQRAERTFFIRRPIQRNQHHLSSNSSVASGFSSGASHHHQSRYHWEAVKWIDDTDFTLYRCPSLGPRHLRGFEMFTIGDCQSILLKLTHDRCVELRNELNAATKEQLIAEQMMKIDDGNAVDEDGFMTESEMSYLAAMERTKTISKKLVVAEHAFALVRYRIETLIAKYEAMLERIEDTDGGSVAASSVITYDESSIYSETEEREAEIWARRARRAELKAEVAAREALMARQEADWIRQESQMELERVQTMLAELQSEASSAVSHQQHTRTLLQRTTNLQSTSQSHHRGEGGGGGAPSNNSSVIINQQTIEDVKQRFRERMRKKTASPQHTTSSRPTTSKNRPLLPKHLVRAAGEEMFSHLDFYERSLKSVQHEEAKY